MANEYDYKDKPFLSKVRIGEKDYYLKDAEARDVIDSILSDYLKAADKTALQNQIDALDGRITTIEGDYITEAELTAAIAAEASARDAAIAAAINALDVNDTAVEGKYVSSVKEVDGKIEVTRETLPTAPEYTIVKQATPDTGDASTYYLTKNGTQVGAKINIAKDQFLKDAKFCATAEDVPVGHTPPAELEFPAILFIFTRTAGDEDVWVPVKDLVDVYTAGNGIDITDNEISAVVKSGDKYLEVTADGIASKDIDDAISAAVAVEQARAEKAEDDLDDKIDDEVLRATAAEQANAKAISDEETRAKGIENGLDARLTLAEADIDALEGVAHTHTNKGELDLIESGDVAKWNNEVGAKAAITAEETRAKAAEKANADAIAAEETRATAAEGLLRDSKISSLNYDNNHTLTAKVEQAQAFTHTFGDLADENLDNLEVKGQTISGVKASGDISGTATLDMGYTSTGITSTGNVTAEGNISVTLKNNTIQSMKTEGSVASFTEGAFTANVPTKLDLTKFNGGSAATYSHSGFSGGSLGEASKDQFCYEGLVAEVGTGEDAECLIFSAAAKKDALTAQGEFTAAVYGTDTFNGGSAASLGDGFYTAGTAASKNADSFTANVLPTFEEKVVDVNTQSFTGSAVAISVNGNYDKANKPTGTVAITGVELAVGDITIADKSVTKKA